MRRSTAGVLVVLLLALTAVGCGGSSASRSNSAARTGQTKTTPTSAAERAHFLGLAGPGLGIFHRYVYLPFKHGSLSANKAAMARAGTAAAAAAREVELAKEAAAGSTALRKLFAPLAAVVPTLTAVSARLNHGHPAPADIKAANAAIAGLEQAAAASGVPIRERAPAKSP